MILITRPREDALEMAEMIETKGYKCLIAPMLEIEYKNLYVGKYTTYITTSKNAKSSVPKNSKLISIPEYGQDANAIYNWVIKNLNPESEKIIYLRGKKITLDLTLKLHEHGFDCDEAVVYEARPVTELKADLSKVTLATFFSTQTLLNFCKLSDKRDLPLLVLSKKIAKVAKDNGFANVQTSLKPTLDSLLNVIYKQDFFN